MKRTLLAAAIAIVGVAGATRVHIGAQSSCDDLLSPQREVNGKKVGPTSCLLQEADIDYDGRKYKRVDIGLDGTVDGYAAKVGDYKD